MSGWIPPITPTADRTYLSLYLRADEQTRLYKREEYGVLTYFGDLGGLLDFVLVVGSTFSSFFVSRLLQAAIVKQVYRIQRYLLDNSPYYSSSKPAGELTTESDSQSEEIKQNSFS